MSVHNGERYLAEAINSILYQTFADFEFFIVNDGSTDGTQAILDRYTDSRIWTYSLDESIGLTRALNWAIGFAHGEYIARMDADDISEQGRLYGQSQYLDRNPNVGLVGGWYYQIDELGQIVGVYQPPESDYELRRNLWARQHLAHGTFMFRKKVIEETGNYNESYRYSQDYEFLLRVADHYEIASVPFIVYRWRSHSGGVSAARKSRQQQYAVQASISNLEHKEANLLNCCRLSLLHLKAAKDEFKNAFKFSKLSPLVMLREYLSLVRDKSYKLRKIKT